jgi:hypothetical protein
VDLFLSDADGQFEFSEVSPGRYVVGVDLTLRMDPKIAFPPTLHPGTRDATVATVVQIDGGQHHDLEPMTLPPARRSFTLTGTVVYENGSPASGVFLSLSDGAERWMQVAVGKKTGSDGAFSFTVHEGLSYIARASYWNEEQRKPIGATVGPFVVTQDTKPLTMVRSPSR